MAEMKLEPNSKASKAENRKVKKIVKEPVAIRKPSPEKRLKEAFVAEDGGAVKSYLVWDVLIPAVKETIANLVKQGIDALLYGQQGSPRSTPSNITRQGNQSYVSYASYSTRKNDPPFQPDPSYRRTSATYQRRAAHDFGDIILKSRSDAEEVLSQLVEITMQYGETSVADFYELVGIQSQYTDNKFGWEELSEARVMQVRGGYILDLPRPIALER